MTVSGALPLSAQSPSPGVCRGLRVRLAAAQTQHAAFRAVTVSPPGYCPVSCSHRRLLVGFRSGQATQTAVFVRRHGSCGKAVVPRSIADVPAAVAAGFVAGTFMSMPTDPLHMWLIDGLALHAGSGRDSDDSVLLGVAAEVLLQNPSSAVAAGSLVALLRNEALPASTAAEIATRPGTTFEQLVAYLKRSDADPDVFRSFVADAVACGRDSLLAAVVESATWNQLSAVFASDAYAEAYVALTATGSLPVARSLVRSSHTPTAVRLVAAKQALSSPGDVMSLDELDEVFWSALADDLGTHAGLFEHVPCSGLRRLTCCAGWDGLAPQQLETLVDDVAEVVDGWDRDPPPAELGFGRHTDRLLQHPAMRRPVYLRLLDTLQRLPPGSYLATTYKSSVRWQALAASSSLDGPCLFTCSYSELVSCVTTGKHDLRRVGTVLGNPVCDLPLLQRLLQRITDTDSGFKLVDDTGFGEFRDMLTSWVSTVTEFVVVSLLFEKCTGAAFAPHRACDVVASSSEGDLVEALHAARPAPRLVELLQKRIVVDAPWLLTDRVIAEFTCSALSPTRGNASYIPSQSLLRFLRGRFGAHIPFWRMFFELLPASGSLGEIADLVLAVESSSTSPPV